MVAIFGGMSPHPVTIEAGGVTTTPKLSDIARYRSILERAEKFMRQAFMPDVLAVAEEFTGYFNEGHGYGNLLSYPYFPNAEGEQQAFAGGVTIGGRYQALDIGKITEDHPHSFYKNEPHAQVKPLMGSHLEPISWDEYQQEIGKADGKYSWARAPRYGGNVMEVGPAARVVNTYHSGRNPKLNALVDQLNKQFKINLGHYPSVMGRHLSRYICSSLLIDLLHENLEQLQPGKSGFIERDVPKNASGYGLTEATRGALAHWIETDANGYIKRYELIVPTTWNISPRDASGQHGAVERMLVGTKVNDPANPLELTRIIRSTDPCMACSVH